MVIRETPSGLLDLALIFRWSGTRLGPALFGLPQARTFLPILNACQTICTPTGAIDSDPAGRWRDALEPSPMTEVTSPGYAL